jgi:hypothetical protein
MADHRPRFQTLLSASLRLGTQVSQLADLDEWTPWVAPRREAGVGAPVARFDARRFLATGDHAAAQSSPLSRLATLGHGGPHRRYRVKSPVDRGLTPNAICAEARSRLLRSPMCR